MAEFKRASPLPRPNSEKGAVLVQRRESLDQTQALSRYLEDKLSSAHADHQVRVMDTGYEKWPGRMASLLTLLHPPWGAELETSVSHPISRLGAKAPGQRELEPPPRLAGPLGASAGQQLAALHLQAFAQEEGILLGVPTQEELQHDAGVLGATWSQDAASVVQANLQWGRRAVLGEGPSTSHTSSQGACVSIMRECVLPTPWKGISEQCTHKCMCVQDCVCVCVGTLSFRTRVAEPPLRLTKGWKPG